MFSNHRRLGSGRMSVREKPSQNHASAVLQRKQSEKKRKKREVLLPPDPRAPPKKSDVAAATMDEGIGKGGASPDQVVVIVEEGCKIEGAKSQEVLGGKSKGCCSVM